MSVANSVELNHLQRWNQNDT